MYGGIIPLIRKEFDCSTKWFSSFTLIWHTSVISHLILKKLCEFQNLLEKFYLMVLVPSLYDWLRGNGKEAKITIQICKIRQPPIFAKKLQISIKSDFANQLFNFLQECVQKGEYFGAYMVPIHEHFFSKISHIHRWHLWHGTKKVQ